MDSKKGDVDRRDFIKTTAVAGLGVAIGANRPSPFFVHRGSPAEKVVVAVIGVNGRGVVHAQNFAALPNSEVAYICDVDANVLSKGVSVATRSQRKSPTTIADFRRALDDKSVDAIAIATP